MKKINGVVLNKTITKRNLKDIKRGIYYPALYMNRRIVKEKLVEHFGKCYWCYTKVKIYKDIPVQERPSDEATLDHIKSKTAGREKHEVTPKVLSCRKCNSERAAEEIKQKLKSIQHAK